MMLDLMEIDDIRLEGLHHYLVFQHLGLREDGDLECPSYALRNGASIIWFDRTKDAI